VASLWRTPNGANVGNMRALLLGENSKRQPAIQISTELKWLIDIGPVQGCAFGLVNGWRACRDIAAKRRSPHLLSLLIHQLGRKRHTTIRAHLKPRVTLDTDMTAPSSRSNIRPDAKFSPSEKRLSSDAQSAVQTPPISSAGVFRRVVGTMMRGVIIGAMVVITLAWIAILVWLAILLVRLII
jgi:hypothetical protein